MLIYKYICKRITTFWDCVTPHQWDYVFDTQVTPWPACVYFWKSQLAWGQLYLLALLLHYYYILYIIYIIILLLYYSIIIIFPGSNWEAAAEEGFVSVFGFGVQLSLPSSPGRLCLQKNVASLLKHCWMFLDDTSIGEGERRDLGCFTSHQTLDPGEDLSCFLQWILL